MRLAFLTACMLGLAGCYPAGPQIDTVDLSAPGESMDDYAARVLDSLQLRSFKKNREYCGLILRTPDGRLAATPANTGAMDSCEILDPLIDGEIVATYHTHGGDDVEADSEVPSVQDLESDMAEGLVGYVATPGGRLWRTDPIAAEVRLICKSGCVQRAPDFTDCGQRAAGSRHTLKELRAREETMLGTCPL